MKILIVLTSHEDLGDTDWGAHVVVDGKLVTGQNPASSAEAARKLLELVG